MYNIKINNKDYQVEKDTSIIKVCDALGIKIPRFCYHSKLSVPANCRMCLVEVKGQRKPVPACHTNVAEGMEIFTETELVQKVRKAMMEFLLINHPLDCPICDQGGECGLQNQAIAYGYNDSSYEFYKRARVNKELGPLISTAMTRCINCTRCIRFMDEIAGIPDLGLLNRGENAEISNYFQKPIDSELSGNLVDVCPVGALNNAQYLYKARAWQLQSGYTIDILDAMGSNIRVDIEGDEVLRILPKQNNEINEVWISDKIRYIGDSINLQRIDSPWIRVNGKLERASWEEAFDLMKKNIKNLNGKDLAAVAGKFADVESMLLLKEFMQSFDANTFDCRLSNINISSKNELSYLFNSTIAGIDRCDCILIIGSNIKVEAPVLNARIRKRVKTDNLKIGVVGKDNFLTYNYNHLGTKLSVINSLLDGTNEFSDVLKNAKNPMIIVGEGAFLNQDANAVLTLIQKLCDKYNVITESWNGYNFLSSSANILGGLSIGFTPEDENITINDILNKASVKDIKFLWLLNVDELDFSKLQNTFVVYQGHHGDEGARNANVILPSLVWLEKEATYVNIEGRPQQTNIVKKAINNAKEDWKIIKAFSDFIGKSLPYNDILEVRLRMQEVNPIFKNIGLVTKRNGTSIINQNNNSEVKDIEIENVINDFYLTDILSKHSPTLVKCSKLFKK